MARKPRKPRKPELGVALVGYAFMGRAHSNAYQQVGRFFPDCPLAVRRKVLVGRSAKPLAAAATTWGWEECSTDFDAVLARDDIDLVDIGTPNDSHYPLVMAAIAAGKHVLCEKPLALTAGQCRTMAAAAKRAQVRVGLWHNYRRCPAASLAAELVTAGRLGEIRQVRAIYLQDWLGTDACPATWRTTARICGSGAHGDLNAHLIDMTRFLTGLEFTSVVSLQETFTRKRRAPDGRRMVPVDVDDAFLFLAKLSNGATASFEATRVATGRKNYHQIEVNGTRGSLLWNFERMNELQFFSADDLPAAQGFRTIMCMDGTVHPYAGNYWPDGHIIGYEHTFTNTLHDFLVALHAGTRFRPDFTDGWATQEVLDAALRSARTRRWVAVRRVASARAPARPAVRNPGRRAGITG
jgi:predicted dehydrogenase